MEYNGYILNTDGLIIDENQVNEIKKILDTCNSDAIFFNNTYKNKVEGLGASAFNLKREHFITLNECVKPASPALFGFVKKEYYDNENALVNIYSNENIKTISISNVILGNRDTTMPKYIKTFIQKYLPKNAQEFYLEQKVEQKRQTNSLLARVIRKAKRVFKK